MILFFIILQFYIICSTIRHKKTLDEFKNIVNSKSQFSHSRQLLVHIQTPRHHHLLNQQQCLSLLFETKIKTMLFCIPKIPSIMMQPSQKMMTYSLVRQQENKIIALQPFRHLLIIHNVLIPHTQVYQI